MIAWPRLLQSRACVAALSAVGVFGVVVLGRWLGLVEPAELGLYDRLLRWRAAQVSVKSRVALVTYTEADIQGQVGFPLSDEMLAETLATVLRQGPRSIGVDLYRDTPIEPGAGELTEILLGDPRTVMIYRYGDVGVVPIRPPEALSGSQRVGFNDFVLDRDQAVRRAILYQDDEELGTGISLGLRVALLHLAHEGVELGLDPDDPNQLRLGTTTIPRLRPREGGYANVDSAGYQTLIRFDDPPRFASHRISDVLNGNFEPEAFRDRMVFVGVTAETHSDLANTPFGQLPGVVLHAYIAEQLVGLGLGELSPRGALAESVELGWILLWSALGASLGLSLRSARLFLFAAGGGVLAIGASGALALGEELWVPMAAPALAWLGSAGVVTVYLSRREHAERSQLMQLFSRHMSSDVAWRLWEKRAEFLHGGRPRSQPLTATVMFLDLKGFSGAAEELDAIELMPWINDFLSMTAQEADRHGGIVDDYFGDGIKVDFGVPIPRRTEDQKDADAVAAVRCALATGQAMRRLNEAWEQKGQPTAAVKIGISTGNAVAGSIGSENRLKYTIVGDIVNVAARLEALDYSQHDFEKQPWRILISGQTRSRVGCMFRTRDIGLRSVKGRVEKVHVHEVLGPVEAVPQAAQEGMT